MPRKVSHNKNIFPKINKRYISGDIIEFVYKSDDIYDNKPIVFVLNKTSKMITGININYINEYKVSLLLEERNFKKLKYYNYYEKAFRTYSTKKMSMIKVLEFKTNKMLAEEDKIKVESKLRENELKLRERELKKQRKIDESKL